MRTPSFAASLFAAILIAASSALGAPSTTPDAASQSNDGISPETFKAIEDYWRSVTASAEKFDDAVRNLEPATSCEPISYPNTTNARNRIVTEVRARLFERHDDLRIWNVSGNKDGYAFFIGDIANHRSFFGTVAYVDGNYQLRCLDPVVRGGIRARGLPP